jgi:hypothetical protein
VIKIHKHQNLKLKHLKHTQTKTNTNQEMNSYIQKIMINKTSLVV